LVDACGTANPAALTALLPVITEFAMRGVHPDAGQRARLRIAFDQPIPDDDGSRERLAFAMAPVELYACFDRARAIELWDIASDTAASAPAAPALYNLGLMHQMSAPIVAARDLERAMLIGEGQTSSRAAAELARLAEQLGDDIILARASERILELAN